MAQVIVHCPACRVPNTHGGRFCQRCGAYLIDVSLGRAAPPLRRLAATAVDWGVVGATFELNLGGLHAPWYVADGSALVLIGYLVWWLMLFSDGGSPGKRLFGLQVIDDTGNPPPFLTMLIRDWFAKVLSAGILGLGLLWALIDDNRQAWHDKILGTYVIARGPVPIAPRSHEGSRAMPPGATTMGGVRRI